jgi:hypothetical protein
VPDPEIIQSAEENQEIPTEDAAVMPAGEPRKRRRFRYMAAEIRRKRKDKTWENHESRIILAAACSRKMSRHATVAWQKRKLVQRMRPRKIVTRARN